MLHYFVEDMFTKVLISPLLPDPYNQLELHVISEMITEIEVDLEVKVQSWSSLNSTYQIRRTIPTLEPQKVTVIKLNMSELLPLANCYLSGIPQLPLCFLTMRLIIENFGKKQPGFDFLFLSRVVHNGEVLSSNKLIPPPNVANGLKVPNLKITRVSEVEAVANSPYKKIFEVEIQTDAVALYVWLEANGKFKTLKNWVDRVRDLFKYFAKEP